jgi:hypothetical protein
MADDINSDTVVHATKQQVSADLGEEAVILGLDSSIYYGLNEVGARVWQLVQEPRTVASIRDTLVLEFDVEPHRCERDVVSVLRDMQRESLIEVKG